MCVIRTSFTAVKKLPRRMRIPKICAQKQDQWLQLVWTYGFRGKKSFKNLIEHFLRKIDLKICLIVFLLILTVLNDKDC